MRTRWRPAARASAAVSFVVLAAACGSAVPHADVVRAAGGSGTGTVNEGGTTGDATDATTGTVGEGSTTGTGGTSTGAGSTSGSGATGGSSTGGTSGATGTTGAGTTGTNGTTGTSGSTTGSGGGGDTSEIVIGTVGNFSGAPGVVNKPGSVGVQVWAKAVNAKGGIAGHPVRVIVVDDTSDPARYRQILQDLVENKKVIAFVGNGTSQTVQAGTTYLEKVRVPVIGSGDGSPAWRSSKMQFPVAGSADALVYGNFLEAKKQGKPKIAIFSCVEASSCTGWEAGADKYAPKVGVEIVYKADISITQADFTSECIRARNAGAQTVAVIADSNTWYRAARSCGAQGFKPTYIAAAPNDVDLTKADLEGSIGAMHTFPFFGVPGDPFGDEYLAALKRYGADEGKGMYLATGWASGKLFEAAFLKGIGSGKPTSAGVLEGLWSLRKGETLGGWLSPINFKREGANSQAFCYYPAALKSGRWNAPDGMKPTCGTP